MEAQNLSTYRELILKAENSQAATKQYLALATKDFNETKMPIYEAYLAVGNFLMAKHVFSPFSKIAYFKKGKMQLEGAVAKAPNNLEIRFLRYTCQVEMPDILGYKNSISVDKKFILEHYKESNDVTLVSEIKQYFKI